MKRFRTQVGARKRLAWLILITLIATVPAFAMYCADYFAPCADGSGGFSNVCCGDAQMGFADCACSTWTDGPGGGAVVRLLDHYWLLRRVARVTQYRSLSTIPVPAAAVPYSGLLKARRRSV
jgi:hypothetical protein